METGKRIKAAREKQGLTQKQVADKLQISYVNISQLENGRRIPKPQTLKRIADALDISFADLIGVATLIDGAYTQEELKGYTVDKRLTPAAFLIGKAYEKATPPVQRTVEVALEPFMDDEAHT